MTEDDGRAAGVTAGRDGKDGDEMAVTRWW